MSTEEALAMQAAAEKNGKLLMLGFVRRHGSDARTAVDLISKGYLGDIYYAKPTYLRRLVRRQVPLRRRTADRPRRSCH